MLLTVNALSIMVIPERTVVHALPWTSVSPLSRRLPLRRWVGALSVLLAPVVASCVGGGEERAPTPIAACIAREGELPPDASLVRGAGRYHLTLVAAGGERSVTGALELAANEPPLRRPPATAAGSVDDTIRLPLYGWAAIDLAAVGALEIGDIASRDPLQPGVLVLEQRPAATAPVAITLRFGSIANRRDTAGAVDGGYMALHVAYVTPWGSFAGAWLSGVHARRVAGHFCATRLPETR